MNKGIEKNNDILDSICERVERILQEMQASNIQWRHERYEFVVNDDFHIISTDDILMEAVYLNIESDEDIDEIIRDMIDSGRSVKIQRKRIVPVFVPYIQKDSGSVYCFDYIMDRQMIQYMDSKTCFKIEKTMHLPYSKELRCIAFQNLEKMSLADCCML